MYSFAVLGLFQSSVGVMLQPLTLQYSLSDVRVSFIFIVGPVAYVLAAQLSHLIHSTWGQRGIAILAPTLHILGALGISAHPPFPLVLLTFGAISLGLCSPSVVELCVLFLAFRNESALKYRGEKLASEALPLAMLKHPAIWLSAQYFLAYVGIETAISGWIVLFMIRHRNAKPSQASIASSVFWGGMAVGRFALGALTDQLGEGRGNIVYFLITIALQVFFAFLEGRTASIFLLAFIGFFMGPMFASGVVLLTRLLPTEQHVAAVSFVASAGQVGAALLPLGIGAFIQGMGIGTFRFACIVLTVLAFLTWIPVSQLRPTTSQLSSSLEDHARED
ncbi:MFS general substrate transporter [Cadophora sp. DSE1049]|nr:MFS general substrate transporter [Cadophora sp. DSE1049]